MPSIWVTICSEAAPQPSYPARQRAPPLAVTTVYQMSPSGSKSKPVISPSAVRMEERPLPSSRIRSSAAPPARVSACAAK